MSCWSSQGAPLSLTSDKSTEAYRNWWPGPGDAMVAFMNRSIDLLEEIARATDNRIQLNRRGYLYATADPARVALLRQAAEEAAELGAGPLRIHGTDDHDRTTRRRADEGRSSSSDSSCSTLPSLRSFVCRLEATFPRRPTASRTSPSGADLLLDPALIREHFPYVAENDGGAAACAPLRLVQRPAAGHAYAGASSRARRPADPRPGRRRRHQRRAGARGPGGARGRDEHDRAHRAS